MTASRVVRAAHSARHPSLSGTVALTIVSRSHLPLARVLAASLRAAEPRLPLRTVVADLEPGETVELPGVEVVAAAELGAAPFRWLALKYTPWELCCALKPFAVEHAFRCGARNVVYLDSDIEVHAALDALVEPLERADWVVTPHQRVPFDPDETAGHMPSRADLERCGRLNAGLFGVRDTPAAREFLAWWGAEVAAPGAFDDLWRGGRTEQQLFARVLERDRVRALDRPEHNVAYWNLHERPLAERSGRFEVDDVPLATFHWSGFDARDPDRISRYDSRHLLGRDATLDRLAAAYRESLFAASGSEEPPAWRWDRTRSDAPIDARVRDLVRRYERRLDAGDDPWSSAGERRLARALLAPLADTGTLLPLLFVPIYRERPDLGREFPEAPLAPDRFLCWIERYGVREHGYETWLELAREGRDSPFEVSPLARARTVWSRRADVRRAFADPLGADAAAFAAWLSSFGRAEHGLPEACARAVMASGRSDGRASAWLRAHGPAIAPANAPHELLSAGVASGELELDDVVAWLWGHDAGR